MIKDTLQKQKAIRYCVSTGLVPYPEVVVKYSADVSENIADISDIDVLGVKPAGEFSQKSVLFDCKTQAKISAINRALWSAGLKHLVNAEEAFVILNKAAPEGHRLAANSIGVRLFSEKLFDNFGVSSSINYISGISYLENMSAWEELLTIKDKSKGLTPLLTYLLNEAALERSSVEGFRTLLSRLKQTAGEFDVSKPTHRCLYALAVTQAVIFLAGMTREFHTVFDPEMDKIRFSSALRYFSWGGREGYNLREKLHKALQANKGQTDSSAFELPGWERFVELMRAFMDAPLLVGSAALPLKDLGFREISQPSDLADHRIAKELQANGRSRQFALSVNKYIASLSRMLNDSGMHLNAILSSSSVANSEAIESQKS
nr:hypothetical protein [Comamonas testosteroni]